ncbi:hypothetical protein NPIL_163501 [Nephila pilipes]|uniref:Uncharacterized protein n=1 Tax=Nephila pilipes TaxID=299642 RepID=A0A8X6MS51_NEPPI|nr:hypothetical protein NPIL_163501 [Nephila pilipes]
MLFDEKRRKIQKTFFFFSPVEVKPIFPGNGKSRPRRPERAGTSAKPSGNTPPPFPRRNVQLDFQRNNFFPVLEFLEFWKKKLFHVFSGKRVFSSGNATGNASPAFRGGRRSSRYGKKPRAASAVARCGSREVRCGKKGPIAAKLSENNAVHR